MWRSQLLRWRRRRRRRRWWWWWCRRWRAERRRCRKRRMMIKKGEKRSVSGGSGKVGVDLKTALSNRPGSGKDRALWRPFDDL